MPEPSELFRRQLTFAAHLRDPTRVPGPKDVEDRRMAIYRELVFNNVSALLAGNFPVMRRILPDAHWNDLIRNFFVRHRAETPLFLELGQEFLDFLQTARAGDPRIHPFFWSWRTMNGIAFGVGLLEDLRTGGILLRTVRGAPS